MASRADRLPALRRLAVDPGATPAERALAGRFAAALDPTTPSPGALPSVATPGNRMVLEYVGSLAWLCWRCPSCERPVAHPGAGTMLWLLQTQALATEDARRCWFCSGGVSPLTLDGAALPGAIPLALWRVATGDRAALLLTLGEIREAVVAFRALDDDGGRPALRRRIRRALDAGIAAGALTGLPRFNLRRSAAGLLVVRWRVAEREAR